jgi:hypothetical protein
VYDVTSLKRIAGIYRWSWPPQARYAPQVKINVRAVDRPQSYRVPRLAIVLESRTRRSGRGIAEPLAVLGRFEPNVDFVDRFAGV